MQLEKINHYEKLLDLVLCKSVQNEFNSIRFIPVLSETSVQMNSNFQSE